MTSITRWGGRQDPTQVIIPGRFVQVGLRVLTQCYLRTPRGCQPGRFTCCCQSEYDEARGYRSPVMADYTSHRRTDSDPQSVIPPSMDGWLSASTRLSQNRARFRLLLLAAAWIAIVYQTIRRKPLSWLSTSSACRLHPHN